MNLNIVICIVLFCSLPDTALTDSSGSKRMSTHNRPRHGTHWNRIGKRVITQLESQQQLDSDWLDLPLTENDNEDLNYSNRKYKFFFNKKNPKLNFIILFISS